MRGATCGACTAQPPGAPEITPFLSCLVLSLCSVIFFKVRTFRGFFVSFFCHYVISVSSTDDKSGKYSSVNQINDGHRNI